MGSVIYIPKLKNPCRDNLPNGLIAHYKLEETSGDVVDSIGGVNLEIYGSVTRGETGKLGNSYYFPGQSTAYCRGATPMIGLTEWTIAAWVKFLDQPQSTTGIVSGYATFPQIHPKIGIQGYTNFAAGYSSDGGGNNTSVNANESNQDVWYLVTQRGFIDFADDKVKWNRSLNDSIRTVYAVSGWTEEFTEIGGFLEFGRDAGTPLFSYKGWIDDIKIWNRQISDCEILANYNNGNGVEL